MNTLELFSGGGGLAWGLHKAGFHHAALVEFNKIACQTLRKNFNENIIFEGDVRNFNFNNLNEIKLVAGGPPCQPFSLAGKHKAYDDLRDMFPYAIKAIRNLLPPVFIFENVKGLTRQSFEPYFRYIIRRLQYPFFIKKQGETWENHLNRLDQLNTSEVEPDYHVSYKVVNFANYGVPQIRERVIIVGTRSDLNMEWVFPQETHSLNRLIWDMFVEGSYWDRHQMRPKEKESFIPLIQTRIESVVQHAGFFPPDGLPWVTVRDAIDDLGPPNNDPYSEHQIRLGAKIYPGHEGSEIDYPSKTIKAGGHGVPGGENMIRFEDGSVRYFTVAEAKRIQTFPDSYKMGGAWGEIMRQIGNAVPVKLAELFGIELFKMLHRLSKTTVNNSNVSECKKKIVAI
ncbi:MAG: DNA (cytosine-5-)-methyltransferase [Akkermansia sp.]